MATQKKVVHNPKHPHYQLVPLNICSLFSHVADAVAWYVDQGPGVRRQQWERGQGGPGQPDQLRPGEHPELLLQVT